MAHSISRRKFIAGSALAVAGAALSERSIFATIARAAPEGDSVLVVVFLRGGADGLSICPPHGDDQYYRARPTIALGRPGSGSRSVIDLDGYFGLHPSLSPLEPSWREGRLAVVHAVGSYDLGRSHFDAQEFVETGTPGVKGSGGLLARSLSQLPGEHLMEAVALARLSPRALQGPQSVLIAEDIRRFDFRAPGWRTEAEQRLDAMYGANLTPAGGLGTNALDAIRLLKASPPVYESPHNGATYPDTTVGAGLQQAATIIRSGFGTRCIFVDVEGEFDTHSYQVVNNESDFVPLGQSLAAFERDLGARMKDVIVIVMTEFGRAVYETGAYGTDHGSGGAMLIMGGRVKGGMVHGVWPGIETEALYQGRDLAVTTDYRDVMAEVVGRHLGIAEPDALFPAFEPKPVGLF